MIAYDDVVALKEELERDYQTRHDDFRRLRQFWHGKYWENQSAEELGGISQVFRDLAAKRTDTGPDIKLVHNVLQEVCVKYQSFLSPLPMIRVYTDPPVSDNRKRQATLKERYLYGTWNQRPTAMSTILNRAGWYLPLMGDCFLGCFPDLASNLVRPVLRSPEYAYPVMAYDGSNLDAIIFSWEASERRVAREFPNYTYQADRNRGRLPFLGGRLRKRDSEPKVTLLEYSDSREFARWAGEQKLNGVEHEFGFNLFDQVDFIHVPDEAWNHGAVEQAVGMVELGNALHSLMLQAVIENVFPTLFLIDPSKAPEYLDLGAGGVVGINPGGDVKWVAPPVQGLQAQLAMLEANEQKIKQATSMPDVSFGQFDASIITGKAINELQGAGTGSTVEMVQGNGIGRALVSWNEKALWMGRTMFKDETINLAGFEKDSILQLVPRAFTVTVKGRELVGSTRNEVVFMPHIGEHQKLVMMLQALGAKLVSRQHARENMGIPDSAAMEDEIYTEALNDAVLGTFVQALAGLGATPEEAAQVEQQGLGFLAGSTVSAAQPALGPGPMTAGGPPALPPGMPTPLPGGGSAVSPPFRQPPGSPAPAAPTVSAPQPGGPVTLAQAVQAFQGVQGVQGRVFLVGELVATGRTANDIEVALTDPSDRQVLADSLRQYAGRLVFHTVKAEPSEPHVEVTPGAAAEAKGATPDLAALVGA